jgi:protein O-GlcNAc transferase
MNVAETLQLAVQKHRSGNMPGAEALYRQILAEQPNHPDALHLMGVLASQTGRYDLAVDHIGRAIALNPQAFQFHLNLGVALNESGRTAEAIASFQRALALQPGEPRVLCNLSYALWKADRIEEAIDAAQKALAQVPNYPEAHNNLGNALQIAGRLPEAVEHFQKAIALRPNVAETHANMASVLSELGRLDEAVAAARRALELAPTLAVAQNNLGVALVKLGRPDEGAVALRQAVTLRPAYAEAYYNLGVALADDFDYPAASVAWKKAIELEPDHSTADSNRVFLMQFDPSQTCQSILREHKEWDRRHAAPLAGKIRRHENDRDAKRRLKIGYVSPDFRMHVVGWSILPLLAKHDHKQFEIYCYSSSLGSDEMTGKIRKQADHWREIGRLEDDEAAEVIRKDRIDVLIDLAGHTLGNRLLVFAQKPAPVQATYLGYPGTTGLAAMDYRFSDPFLDPPDADLSCYCEKTIRLPKSYWCYECAHAAPDVTAAPGTGVFGCLNNFGKVTTEALDLWADLLSKVPDSRLVLNCEFESHRQAVRNRFAARGIAGERLEFFGRRPWAEFAATFAKIDVLLDTFPYAGGITTCDSLWMGVPVVTLRGSTVAGRGGCSVLNNIGLGELAAGSAEEYVRIASDWRRLIAMRATLREKMRSSPLMDAAGRARDFEAAVRGMWVTYCA